MHKPIKPTTQKKEEPISKPGIKDICNVYNERLRIIVNGSNYDYSPLELGMPSKVLLECGIPDLPIQMAVLRLIDKKLQSNHPFSIASVAHMPEYLAEPIAVFQSKTRGDCKVILTEMDDKGINIVVVVEMKKLCGKLEVNSVRSVYPKDNIKDILQWIYQDDLLEYADKEKILNWFSKQQSNSADVTKLIKDCTNIVQKL